MKEISSLKSLQDTLNLHQKSWLLLYKKGSTQSDCAFDNFSKITDAVDDSALLTADVNTVRDIHTRYAITSVPTLLNFEQTQLKKTIKGCQQAEQLKAVINNNTFTAYSAEGNKAQKNVVVYTTPTCGWCTAVKRHFDANGIRYREINVAADAQAAEAMMKKSGQQGVPQTEINGQMVVGFDKTRINSLLGIN